MLWSLMQSLTMRILTSLAVARSIFLRSAEAGVFLVAALRLLMLCSPWMRPAVSLSKALLMSLIVMPKSWQW